MSDPYDIVRQFEKELAKYTGAPFAVAVNSCTMALLLSCSYMLKTPLYDGVKKHDGSISIPKRTYISVPMSIIHAGGKVVFREEDWKGQYRLKPFQILDSARRFTSNMYTRMQFQCLSFHASKILGDTQGGAILHDDPIADVWLRKARFDGRTEGVPASMDHVEMIGHHCCMSPDVSARLLWKMQLIPEHNKDLPNDDYPSLDKMEIFQ